MMKSKATATPFPQANNVTTLMNVMKYLSSTKGATVKQVSETFGLSQRQGNYYISAIGWLGLCSMSEGAYRLTTEGRRVQRMTRMNRLNYIARKSSENPVFAKVYTNKKVTKTDLRRSKIHKLSEATQNRRISTAQAWSRCFRENNVAVCA